MTVFAMLHSYVNEYATSRTYAYNNAIHLFTRTKPFNIVLSNPHASFLMSRSFTDADVNGEKNKDLTELVARVERAKETTHKHLQKPNMRYKKDFKKLIRLANRHIQPGQSSVFRICNAKVQARICRRHIRARSKFGVKCLYAIGARDFWPRKIQNFGARGMDADDHPKHKCIRTNTFIYVQVLDVHGKY